MPALDAEPPSELSLDGGGVASWLHAEGTIVTVHKARTMAIATILKPDAITFFDKDT
jgi:hypothetical protein